MAQSYQAIALAYPNLGSAATSAAARKPKAEVRGGV